MRIPQVIEIKSAVQEALKLRVAAYARVSSNSEDQLHSFATQVKHYSEKIKANDNWCFVDIYADEGFTGTKTENRSELLRLLADCRQGLIDRILVKSISRLSRNTKECLEIIRELKSLGISIFFEKEDIDTLDATSEVFLTLHSAMAQEESMSLSQNLRWSIDRRMRKGEYVASLAPYAYRRNGDNLLINEDEAIVVEKIYEMFLNGKSLRYIANHLNETAIASPKSKNWRINTIIKILTNEKYCGDILLHKRYITPTLPRIEKINRGEITQYYIENNHKAIISKQNFLNVKSLIDSKNILTKTNANKHINSETIQLYCEICSSKLRTKINEGNKMYFVCRSHFENKQNCPVMPVRETDIHRAFLLFFNKLLQNKELLFTPMLTALEKSMQKILMGSAECSALNEKIADLLNQSHALSKLHAKNYLDSATYLEKNNVIEKELTSLRAELSRKRKPNKLNIVYQETKNIIDILDDCEPLIEFDKDIFKVLIKKATIDNDNIYFELKNGLKFSERIKDSE